MSMDLCFCVSMPTQNTHFRLSGRPLVEECIHNIGLQGPYFQKKVGYFLSKNIKLRGFGPPCPLPEKNIPSVSWRILVKEHIWASFFCHSLTGIMWCQVI